MNNKVEIWKRKLAKNKRKQKQAMWDRLKYIEEEKSLTMEFKVHRTTINAKAHKLSASWTMVDELGDE